MNNSFLIDQLSSCEKGRALQLDCEGWKEQVGDGSRKTDVSQSNTEPSNNERRPKLLDRSGERMSS